MTQFIIVNPRQRTIEAFDCATIIEAQSMAGLGEVDHGVIGPGLGYCVYQYGLFVSPHEQHYCGVGGQLIAGPAVFYGFDERGETRSLRTSEFPDVRWFLGVNDVEHGIRSGEIDRPFMAVGGMTLWEWPQPAPNGVGYAAR